MIVYILVKIHKLILTVAVLAIAIKQWMPSEKPAQQQVKTIEYVVDVVGRASTPYDAMGSGSTGFVVKNGSNLEFIDYDVGSWFDAAAVPSQILVIDNPHLGKRIYTPLFREK